MSTASGLQVDLSAAKNKNNARNQLSSIGNLHRNTTDAKYDCSCDEGVNSRVGHTEYSTTDFTRRPSRNLVQRAQNCHEGTLRYEVRPCGEINHQRMKINSPTHGSRACRNTLRAKLGNGTRTQNMVPANSLLFADMTFAIDS